MINKNKISFLSQTYKNEYGISSEKQLKFLS